MRHRLYNVFFLYMLLFYMCFCFSFVVKVKVLKVVRHRRCKGKDVTRLSHARHIIMRDFST